MIHDMHYYFSDNEIRARIAEECGLRSLDKNILSVTEDGIPIRKLFISNLAERTTYKDLINLFSKYGHVENCYLRRTKEKSNHAFVTFSNVSEAVRARKEDIRLHNRNLRVMAADSWHQPDSIENQYRNTGKDASEQKKGDESLDHDYTQDDGTTGIHMLNDDCLTHIFLLLPIVHRVRIERVCKRWRAVSQQSWHRVKKLDLLHSTWGFPPSSLESQINTVTLRKVLLRCGRFLNEINLSLLSHQLSHSTLTIVGKLCPNVQNIDVTGLVVSTSGIKSLKKNCHNIIKFSLGSTMHTCDSDLEKLFKVNRGLRYLTMITSTICGKCLLHLPSDTMEQIVLRCCLELEEDIVLQAIAKLKNLRSLSILECISFYLADCLFSIETCANLRILQLSGQFVLLEPEDMLHITQLANLEVLYIVSNSCVTDDFLVHLTSNCQRLTYLDITGCYVVTNNGIKVVMTLPKLEVLIINYLINVSYIELHGNNTLRKLECRNCNLSDKALSNIIQCCSRLQVLDLSGCTEITNDTLKKAAAVTKRRTNNTVLRIFVGGTAVELRSFDEVSPFLQIVNVDLSYGQIDGINGREYVIT